MYPRLLLAALALAAPTLRAQAPTSSSRPAIRPLGSVKAVSKDSLGTVNNIRALPGGKLLVNDITAKRVLLLDSTFAVLKVVADTTPGNPNAYGGGLASLIAFRGDSTLFVDAQSLSMLVIDANGEVQRVMSVPRAQDAMMLAAGGMGAGAYYSEGHLVYRGMPGMRMQMSSTGTPQMPTMADTMAITRVNLQTRVVDTLGFVKIPKTNTSINRTDDGKMNISIEVNPLPTIDDWAVLPNGTVGFLRGRDYHVDWVDANGTRRESPKMAFDWKRMTDEDKTKLVDSVKTILDKQAAANPSQGAAMASAFGAAMGGAGGARPQVVMRFEASAGPAGGAPARAPQISAPKINVVSASEIPDYQPPFFANNTRADADGNIWVLTIATKPQPAGSVYDVINSQGVVTERVLIPEGRTILGFGPGGVVYLAQRTPTSTVIERATVR
ncbi:hypothetical protein [Gemmatimonas phototrophica]|uniref:hypothetical protein n=1 Tax=Gemmatimonas phototrophica TaxID=1379270 RepID=UPI0011AE3ABE|nr:hypothetical protein [Gemmatimonas phototrophica]